MHYRRIKILVVLLLFPLILSGKIEVKKPIQVLPTLLSPEVEKQILEYMDDRNIPGLSVILIKENQHGSLY